MGRRKGVESHIETSKGFATEINPVVSSPEVLIDINNCVIDTDATIRRRLGVTTEVNGEQKLIGLRELDIEELEEFAFSTGLWTSVSNIGTFNLIVQQHGLILQFYEQFGIVSANLIGELDLTTHAVNIAALTKATVQIASGMGNLYVVSEHMRPIKVKFDGGVFTATEIKIRIRDTEGIPEPDLKIDERPTTLNRNHYYNLRNQGWTDENILKFAGLASTVDICASTGAPLAAATSELLETGSGIYATELALLAQAPDTSIKDFPSNADIMSVGIITNSDGDLEFDGNFIRDGEQINSPAAKGHFILDAFNQDLDEAVDCVGTGTRVFPTRPQTVAFHQGRAFYTTPNVNNRIGGIFYSQQLVTEDRDGECFQEADPTASEINGLVDTDGGFLPAPGVGQVYKLQELANGIVIFASNGVWYLTGADTSSAFTATSLRLDKIHSSGATGASSIVEAEGSVFFFGEEGIMVVGVSGLEGATVQNITRDTIHRFYTAILGTSLTKATGVFVPTERKIYWAYASPQAIDANLDTFLILDLDVGGFYKYSIDYAAGGGAAPYPRVVGLSKIPAVVHKVIGFTTTLATGEEVTLSDTTTLVTTDVNVDVGQVPELKLATLIKQTGSGLFRATFSEFTAEGFRDWPSLGITNSLAMVSSIDFAQSAMGAIHTNGKPTWVHTFYTKNVTAESGGGSGTPPPGLGCIPNADIVLLLDISNSMVSSGFLATDIIPGIKGLITDLLAIEGVKIAIDGFSTQVKHFQDFTNVEAVLFTAVDDAYVDAFAGQSTALGGGIDLAATTVGDSNPPDGRERVIFIITDGVGNIPQLNPLQDAFDSAEALTTASLYVAGIGGRDGFNDLYLETFIATTPGHYSQIDNFTDMLVELAKVATCPDTVPAPEDYLNTTYVTHWDVTPGTFDVADTRVEWIESFSLYVMLSEAFQEGANTLTNIHTSPDGIVWTKRDTALTTTALFDLAYSPVLDLVVAVGLQDTNIFVDKGFRTSTDGITWTEVAAPLDAVWEGVSWSVALNLFIATGSKGLASSPTGAVWTMREVTKTYRKSAYSPALGLWVATQRGGTGVATSTDGLTWTPVNGVGSSTPDNIVWSPEEDIFVMAGISDSSTAAIQYSTNGTTWTLATLPAGAATGRRSIRWFPVEGKFISVEDDDTLNIISSTDGITWVEETARAEWPPGTTLTDVARKSATEWVLIREGGMVVFFSILAPF